MNDVSPPRIIFLASTVLLLVSAWARALIYHLNRDEIDNIIRSSSRVADKNVEFVVDSQQFLLTAWIAVPVVVLALAATTLYLGIGHLLLIGFSGVFGATLFATGLLFPTTIFSMVLAVIFMLALVTVVYMVIARSDRLVGASSLERTIADT